MPKAYSYLRFSTPEQALGDSHRRQVALAEEYAERHGLALDRSLTYGDLGVSAYRGANAETGRLGDFLEAVRKNRVSTGSYLLVESLDRISRQAARKALRTLEDIVELGITVVTLSDGRSYDAEALDNDPMSLMIALLIFIRANEESETKSRRLKAAWSQKRANASEKPLTARVPPWLRLNTARQFETIEERANVVRRIFALADGGMGEHLIAKQLNIEDIEPFGNASRKAAFWHRSYIAKLLRNESVIGRLTPHTQNYVEGKKIRTAQPSIDNYYPPILSRELFDRVRSLKTTASPLRGRHSTGLIQNILGGIAKCPECGSSMTRVSKGPSRRSGKPYLLCTKAKSGKGCTTKSIRLDLVEKALASAADEFVFYGAVRTSRDLRDRGIRLRRRLAEVEGIIQNLVEAISKSQTPSEALLSELALAESELVAIRQERTQLADRLAIQRGPDVRQQYSTLRQALKAPELDRAFVNTSLRRLLDEVTVDAGSGSLLLKWKNEIVTRVLLAQASHTTPI
jgi:DNA invertase Pin-like site-specific DNA recombinase